MPMLGKDETLWRKYAYKLFIPSIHNALGSVSQHTINQTWWCEPVTLAVGMGGRARRIRSLRLAFAV